MRAPGRLFATLIALALSGCQGITLPETTTGTGSAAEGSAPTRSVAPRPPTRISIGEVVVAAPQGYCVDTRARRGNYVLLAACSAISQSPDHPAPGRAGLLSATIGKRGSGQGGLDPTELSAYFRSAPGRETLSYAGEAATVSVVETRGRDGAFYLALTDTAPPPRPELGPARWRALFTVNGRLVSVLLHSLKDDPISREGGLSLLHAFVTRIRAESAG